MGIDPVGVDENNVHSHNRYAYANNNPYRFVDPDGRDSKYTFEHGVIGITQSNPFADSDSKINENQWGQQLS